MANSFLNLINMALVQPHYGLIIWIIFMFLLLGIIAVAIFVVKNKATRITIFLCIATIIFMLSGIGHAKRFEAEKQVVLLEKMNGDSLPGTKVESEKAAAETNSSVDITAIAFYTFAAICLIGAIAIQVKNSGQKS